MATNRSAPALTPSTRQADPRERHAADRQSGGQAEALPSFSTDPAATLPKTVAQLIIRAGRWDGAPIFTIQGMAASCMLPHLADRRYGRPDLALARLVTKERYLPVEAYHALREWSWEKAELHGWLNELRARHGDDLHLIIWDDTDYEIPWELFWLPGVPEAHLPGGWLGALVSVTRNTTVIARSQRSAPQAHADGSSRRPAKPNARRPVVAFVDSAMAGDKAVIAPLRPRHVRSFRELLEYFEQPHPVAALAYVACHGRFAPDRYEIFLADVTMAELGSRTRDLMVSPPEVVFLNACHSARPMPAGQFGDANPRGFSQLFLRAGASGVIGTTGEVGLDNGRRIAEALLTRLADNPELPIAVVLRDYRRVLADSLAHPPRGDRVGQLAALKFINTFMYVYYGDPAACLRLTTARSGPS